MDVVEGSTAGPIDEKAVESIAGAAARRKPSVLGPAASGESAQSPSASTPNPVQLTAAGVVSVELSGSPECQF